jgi:hypothetical protein
MRRIIFAVVFLFLLVGTCHAQALKTYFNMYDPPSTSYVYGQPKIQLGGVTATGDVTSVNTYPYKCIQVTGNNVKEYVHITIEGRVDGEIDSPQWSVLQNVEMGAASADTSKCKVVIIAETVDWIRVGIRYEGTQVTGSRINVKGSYKNFGMSN